MLRASDDGTKFAVAMTPEQAGLAGALALKMEGDGLMRYGVFPRTPDVIFKLGCLGLNLSKLAPFHTEYRPPLLEGEFEPMPHQLETAAFLTVNPRAYCTSEMRTGKTNSVIMALDYLYKSGDEGAALIVCPKTVMSGVWATAIMKTLGEAAALLRGTPAKRVALLKAPYKYYVINYEGLAIAEVFEACSGKIKAGTISKVVLDELDHGYGNAGSGRSRCAKDLFRNVRHVWGLTGTPAADVMKVFGCCMAVNPEIMPWKTKTSWQGAVQYKFGHEAWMWRDRADAGETVRRVMQPNVRFTQAQVMEKMPSVTHTRRDAEMTKEQRKAYADMLSMMFTELDGETVTAAQKAALISKVFQIAAGSVITDNGPRRLDSLPRLKLIEETVLESKAKSVVFVNFVEALAQVTDYLNDRNISAARVDGSVTGIRRDDIFREFQETSKYKVLVAHPATTAYGTELAAADQLILNGPMLSGTHTYMQGTNRLSSVKQKSGFIRIVEIASTPEEAEFFDSLRGREKTANAIARAFESIRRNEYGR
jgi:hypothetical protein